MTRPMVPVSVGELYDKLAILEIKSERISNAPKLANIRAERIALQAACDRLDVPAGFEEQYRRLKQINEALWEIEDQIRVLDRAGEFGPDFVQLARSVYVTNDQRAAAKREINLAFGSELVEEKSYEEHAGDG